MKRCPQCQETYTGEAIKFCRLDGAPLQIINYSPAESSDTLVLPAKDARDTLPTQLLQRETSQAQVIDSPSTTARDLSAGDASDMLQHHDSREIEKHHVKLKYRGRDILKARKSWLIGRCSSFTFLKLQAGNLEFYEG